MTELQSALNYTFYVSGWLIFTVMAFTQWVIYAKLRAIVGERKNEVLLTMANLFLIQGLMFLALSGMPIFVYLNYPLEKKTLEVLVTLSGFVDIGLTFFLISKLKK